MRGIGMGAWDGLHELHGVLGWHRSEKVASVGWARLAPWACRAAGIGGMRGIIGLCVRHAWRTMHDINIHMYSSLGIDM